MPRATRVEANRPGSAGRRSAAISLAVGAAVLGLKWAAYRWTGSVALYSDAVESVVNLVAAAALLAALHVSARPPDADHPYGHGKVEYFSAAFEGTMIAVAASCSYITPLEPSCIMVYGPGRYRFRDFVIAGAGLTVIVYVIVMIMVPMVWPPR